MNQFGRYRLDEVEGVGAFATVWRGFDTDLDVRVAVKVLADNWSHHADVRERFLDEARILRRIHDPRVVRVHDIGEHDGRPYFVMDYLSGGTVGQAVVEDRSLPRAVHLAAESARAVQALHDAGVLHRDVKPSNLLLDGAGDVHVSDLGSAKRMAEASGITVVTGTPTFMAPEQAMGQPLDGRADVYSLGALAYELITGRIPFDTPLGRTPSDRPAPTGAGANLDQVLTSALALKPTDRPETPAALAVALEAAVDAPEQRPGVRVVAVAALSLVGFGAASGLTWWLLQR